ncbi:hypothetical protein [Salinirarus marinus]|uniref:hypothetical protein n=1 Tax=Salinirarus marinus TaxID=3068310 RepID=UPI003C6C9830
MPPSGELAVGRGEAVVGAGDEQSVVGSELDVGDDVRDPLTVAFEGAGSVASPTARPRRTPSS